MTELEKAPDEQIIALLNLLTDEERWGIFNTFCRECGSQDLGCQCWNDE